MDSACWPAACARLTAAERLPQMQWNLVRPVAGRPSRLLGLAGDEQDAGWFYFVHSYAPVPAAGIEPIVVGHCDYGGRVVAAVEQGRLFGTQFHPEKSGSTGLGLLRRFASVCGERGPRPRGR